MVSVIARPKKLGKFLNKLEQNDFDGFAVYGESDGVKLFGQFYKYPDEKIGRKKRIMKNIYNNNQVYTKNSSTSEILRNRTVFIFYNNLL